MSYQDSIFPLLKNVRDIALPSWGSSELLMNKSDRPSDVVTRADKKVESFLREKLSELYPSIGFVGEEDGGDRSAERFWLVDPIDGTGHYMRGLPFCTTMIALVEKGEVIFSVIYDFIHDDIYWAEKGKGAFKNETPIRVSDRSFDESYVCVETNTGKEYNRLKLAEIDEKAGYFHSICAGWEFVMVACGKLDGRVGFEPWGKDYDFAPGSLLVSEAGGTVTNIGSAEYDYRDRNHIAANSDVHHKLTLLLSDFPSAV